MAEKTAKGAGGETPVTFIVRNGLLAVGLTGLGLGMGALLRPDIRNALGQVSPISWLWLFPILGLALAVHEGGHMLAGLWVGFRFLLLVLGPFRLIRGRRGLRLELNPNLLLYGGLTVSQPLDFRNLTRRFATVAAGGPFASLALGLFCAALGYGLPFATTPPACRDSVQLICRDVLAALTRANAPLVLVLLLAAFISISLAISTLVPAETSGNLSDGALLLSLSRSDRPAQLRAYLLMLQAAFLAGDRPRQLDRSLVQRAVAVQAGGQLDALARLYAYYYAIDTGDLLSAYDHLKVALARYAEYPRSLRAILGLEAAYFIAFHHHDPEAAGAWLGRGKGNSPPSGAWLRAEAAVLLAAGHRSEANHLAQLALRQPASSMAPGITRAEREWLEAIIEKASAARSIL